MAISLKALFPGNVDVTDPGYPLGKARNVITAGDGTGTPWEARLTNDIFGFLQSLLMKSGIVASGSPDKVGASQYLAALPLVLLDYAFEWTGAHKFDQQVYANAGVLLDGVIQFDIPGIPRTILPLSMFQPAQLTGGMKFYNRGNRIECHGDGANNLIVRVPLRLPASNEITDCRLCALPNASDITVTLFRSTVDKTSPYALSTATPLATATITGGSGVSTLADAVISGPNEVINNQSCEYYLEVDVGSSNAADVILYWADTRVINKYLNCVL